MEKKLSLAMFFLIYIQNSYEKIIGGEGYGLEDARQSIEIVHKIRYAEIKPLVDDYHPLVKNKLKPHPFKTNG